MYSIFVKIAEEVNMEQCSSLKVKLYFTSISYQRSKRWSWSLSRERAPQKLIGNSDLDDLRGALDDHYADDSYDHWEMIMPGKMLVIMAG